MEKRKLYFCVDNEEGPDCIWSVDLPHAIAWMNNDLKIAIEECQTVLDKSTIQEPLKFEWGTLWSE